MRRLTLFSLRSFIGPFVITFVISMFILIMQFFWKYIDDLMGKGLGVGIIVELLFYVSAVLIPLALPLAVLLSSIMSLGNLAENNELTALKASGLSLFRIMRPLFFFMLVLSFITFYTSNYVIPIANLKMRALIYDIQQTKIASIVKPGTFSKDITGYSIKVEKAKGSKFQDITIYDYNDPKNVRAIKADSAEAFKSVKGDFLFFKLYNGFMNEEVASTSTSGANEGFHPGRKSDFETATFKLELSGFKIERTDEDLFEDQFEMMNIVQLYQATDSTILKYRGMSNDFAEVFSKKSPYIYSSDLVRQFKTEQRIQEEKKCVDSSKVVYFDSIPEDKLKIAYDLAISNIRNRRGELQAQHQILNINNTNLRQINTELHKKFALCVSVLVLFFIGAPLGAIVKKGGFGAPVVIAVFLFMIYYVISITGEGMVKSETVPAWFGIWLSSFFLAPIALFLNWKANKDLPLFSFDRGKKIIQLFRKK